jgi:hypothetical protein
VFRSSFPGQAAVFSFAGKLLAMTRNLNLPRYREVLDRLADRYRLESTEPKWTNVLRAYIGEVSTLYDDYVQLESNTDIRFVDFASRFLDRALDHRQDRGYRDEEESA